jgi:hypothetical protein
MAEDENTLAVGFSNTQITTFETESHTLKSTYQASAIPLSLEFGNNQWMYFIANSSYNNYLHCLNLNNGEISRSQKGESGLLTLLKVPGKDLLVTTKPGYSPDYLFLYDISIGNITDSINEYSMPMDGFWLSDDGERLFTGTKKIFQIPDYIPGKSWTIDHPPIAGELELNYTQVVDYITQQSSTGKIFIATGFGWVGTKTIITQFDHKSFVKQKTYEITSVPPNDFPMGNTWWGKPTKLFPSPNGSKLWLIQKFPARVNNDPDIWSIQKLNLN